MELEEHTVEGGYDRRVWLRRGRGDGPLCVVLDGEFYLQRIDAPVLLDERAELGEATYVFVSHVDAAARHHDFTCEPAYARFVADEVVGWARGVCPGLRGDGHLAIGLSLSGLAAAYIALNYPQTFRGAVCQSGSFWWNDQWLTGQVPYCPGRSGRFWLSVGTLETETDVVHAPTGLHQRATQIEGVERFAAALPGPHRLHRYDGGHEMRAWAEELPNALGWLLKD